MTKIYLIRRIRKIREIRSDKKVTYINLWNKPENEIDSILYSHQVINWKLKGSMQEGIVNFIYSKEKEVGAYYKVK